MVILDHGVRGRILASMALSTPFLLAALAVAASGEQSRVTPPDGVSGDTFGTSIAIDGSVMLVGAPNHDTDGYLSGAVYCYQLQDGAWVFSQALVHPDLEAYDAFGSSIAMEGDMAVIGAPQGNGAVADSGIVSTWFNIKGVWYHLDDLSPSDAEPGDRFGTAIDLDGNFLVVGCQLDDANGPASGSAYVFRRNQELWLQMGHLLPSGGQPYSWAGRSVAIDNGFAIVGAYVESVDEVPAAGAAWVFEHLDDDSWVERERLTADDPAAGDYFGFSLALEYPRLAIGSILNDGTQEDSGAVYLFEAPTWGFEQTQKLLPPDDGGEFGYSIVMHGVDLHIGAVYHPGEGAATGAVYRYRSASQGVSWEGKWLPQSGQDECFFGASLSTDGSRVAVGAPREHGDEPMTGGAYVFPATSSCPGDLDGSLKVDVGDVLAILSAWGYCDDCAQDINMDGTVNVADLLIVLDQWGWCL
jgi:hypothetical protein